MEIITTEWMLKLDFSVMVGKIIANFAKFTSWKSPEFVASHNSIGQNGPSSVVQCESSRE